MGQASRLPVVRNRAFYEAWLKALKTLDFDKLSRPAQVDYLYIHRMAKLQIARDGVAAREPAYARTTRAASPAWRAAATG